MRHIRSKIYHPMTQGKIERYFRSMKNLILLDLYYSPGELEVRIGEWVEYYNNHRYHEAIDNITPSDKYFGKDQEILEQRKKTKTETMKQRKRLNQTIALIERTNLEYDEMRNYSLTSRLLLSKSFNDAQGGYRMENIKKEIEEMVNRETKAWDTQDVDLLMTLFHQDMVWPWPRTPQSHDPMEWVLEWGRYNYDRWKNGWQELFDTHKLIHNNREIQKIVISEQGDGAFAVVDIDTLWVDLKDNKNHWKGRVGKVYTKIGTEWKLIMHTGVLDYS